MIDLGQAKPFTRQNTKTHMKALTFKRYGKSPDIGFSNIARPTLQPDELLVQVYAAGLNPIDNMIRWAPSSPS